MIERLAAVERTAFAHTNETLGLLRIVFFSFTLARWRPTSLQWVAGYPDTFRDPPPGLPQMVSGFDSPIGLALIDLALGITIVCGLLGVAVRFSGVAFTVVSLMHHAMVFSFGKIDHDLLWIVVPLVMAFSSWGERSRIVGERRFGPEDRTRTSMVVSVLYVVFAVSFATAGWAKLSTDWLSPSSASARGWVDYYELVAGSSLLGGAALRFLPSWVWEGADWATVALELAPLLCLASVRAVRRIPILMIPFHLSVLLTMGIDFSPYFVVYAFFTARHDVGDRFVRWAGDRIDARALSAGLAAGLVIMSLAVVPVDAILGDIRIVIVAWHLVIFAALTLDRQVRFERVGHHTAGDYRRGGDNAQAPHQRQLEDEPEPLRGPEVGAGAEL